MNANQPRITPAITSPFRMQFPGRKLKCSHLIYRERRCNQDAIIQFRQAPKIFLTATPNLSIALVMFSSDAAANVARRKSSLGTKLSRSAMNQLPLLTSTPSSMAARKTSSSSSRRVLVFVEGYLVWSTLNQSCRGSVVCFEQAWRITYKHASSRWVPADYILRHVLLTSSQENITSLSILQS